MKRALTLLAAGLLLAGVAGSSLGLAESGPAAPAASSGPPAFADVPPCHWAAKAVAKVAKLGLFVGFPPDPAYLSVNALRQVFEGLRCGNPAWSRRFLTDAPKAFGSGSGATLTGFTLKPTITSLNASTAELSFHLSAVVDQGGTRHRLEREGTVRVNDTKAGWQVPYAELAALQLPFLPH